MPPAFTSTSALEDQERRSPLFAALFAALSGAVVYMLSVGPVLTTAERFKVGTTKFYHPLRAFYAPVFAIARSSYFGTRVYEGYVGFWYRLLVKQDFPRTDPPLENLIVSIGSITNGQTSFKIFVPAKLSAGGYPTSQDLALAEIIGKVREHGLLPAGFQQQTNGRLYTFEREREWERNRQ